MGLLKTVDRVFSLMAYLRANKFLGKTLNLRGGFLLLRPAEASPGKTSDLECACNDFKRAFRSVGKEILLDEPSRTIFLTILEPIGVVFSKTTPPRWFVELVLVMLLFSLFCTEFKNSSNPNPVRLSNLFCELDLRLDDRDGPCWKRADC